MTDRRALFLSTMLLAACSARSPETASAPPTHASESSGAVSTTSTDPCEGCASTQSVSPAEHSPDYARLIGQLDALDAVMLGTPDCGRACAHLATICALAERVCALSVDETDGRVQAECKDGRARCQSNTARVAEVCTCPKP